MTMITPSYLGETIEYSSLHACRSTLEDPTVNTEQRVGHGHVGKERGSLNDRHHVYGSRYFRDRRFRRHRSHRDRQLQSGSTQCPVGNNPEQFLGVRRRQRLRQRNKPHAWSEPNACPSVLSDDRRYILDTTSDQHYPSLRYDGDNQRHGAYERSIQLEYLRNFARAVNDCRWVAGVTGHSDVTVFTSALDPAMISE